MTLWSDMIRCASRGGEVLGSAARRTQEYLLSQVGDDGAFRNRGGRGDLYYTALGLSALRALGAPAPGPVADTLASFGDGGELDLVHLSCLARAWACLDDGAPAGGEASRVAASAPRERALREALPRAIRRWRAADGGFAQEPAGERGTVYGCFLAVAACQDCGAPPPAPDAIARCVMSCRAAGGGFSNSPGEAAGLAPVTAGAVQVLRALGRPVEAAWGRWLIDDCLRQGAFVAHPLSPEADLLSTAVGLHAVELLGLALPAVQRRQCEDFVLGLRHPGGGFRGAASDATADCEYTFYGLLAMGHLADGTPG